MRQRKMKQRKSKQSKSLAKILTLGIAAATVVLSMSVPGGLLAPETVYASDNTGTAESGDQGTESQEETIQFDVSTIPNDSATVYVMQVTRLADTDMRKYQYSIDGINYYPLQELEERETFFGSKMVDLHIREVGSDNKILATGNRKIETPRDSGVPTISGADKFSDRTEVTITAIPGAIIYYTTDDTVPTKESQKYDTPITLTETTTIQAIAIEDGHIMSDVVGMAFTKESSGGSSSDGGTSGGSSSGGSSSGSSSDSGSSSGSSSSDSSASSTTTESPSASDTSSSSSSGTYLGRFKLTGYCSCSICTGQWSGGSTASGTTPTAGRTIAMGGVPFGTKLMINGQVYTVEDRGTAYGHVDIFCSSHSEALSFGVQYADCLLYTSPSPRDTR